MWCVWRGEARRSQGMDPLEATDGHWNTGRTGLLHRSCREVGMPSVGPVDANPYRREDHSYRQDHFVFCDVGPTSSGGQIDQGLRIRIDSHVARCADYALRGRTLALGAECVGRVV